MSHFANLSHVTEYYAQQLLFFTCRVVNQDIFCCYRTGGFNALPTAIDKSRERIGSAHVCLTKSMEHLSTDYRLD